jgi:hypothetical protein
MTRPNIPERRKKKSAEALFHNQSFKTEKSSITEQRKN